MAQDPYRYFRPEARELLDGLVQGVLDLEKGAAGKETVDRLLRFAHTLKGAARVVKQPAIAELAHAMEEQLLPLRDGAALDKARIDELLRLSDGVAAGLKTIDPQPAPEAAPVAVAGPAPVADRQEAIDTVRIEIREMDGLLQGLGEAGVQVAALHRQAPRLERGRELAQMIRQSLRDDSRLRSLADELQGVLDQVQRELGGGLDRVEREMVQVRDAADKMRLVTAGALFGALERATRDAARALHREVEFRALGGEHRADAHVLAKLGVALGHLVRNAVAHGIEAPAERTRLRKPAAGLVEIAVEQHGGQLTFSCRDDGRGIDVGAVRVAALKRGLVSESEAGAIDLARAARLLLEGRLSTTAVPDQTSGRGVGLDVVRTAVAELGGEVNLRAAPGGGTLVELRVPVALSSLVTLSVEAAGRAVSLPLQQVERVVRMESAGPARSAGRASIMYEGQSIPFLSVPEALGWRQAEPARCAVIVRVDQSLTAIGAERLLGAGEVVVRPLPSTAAADPVVTGASLDAAGNPCLLLDAAELARAARQPRAEVAAVPAPARAPVLVVDDSLTTRMLEQSILESAGYQVELATSAEMALEKAQARRYSLFLVDVEMPGMDGFEFVARTRADQVLRETPAILVTSRGDEVDRRRGAAAGARAYIVKGEFDQGKLLSTIRGLIG